MRASTWGDRNAPFIVIPPPVTLAQFEASKREIAAGWRMSNGVEVVGPPGLIRAMQEIKPLPWKWIGFGALVAALALWSWLA